MKRRGIAIILVLALSIIAVGAHALEAADAVGTWYLNVIEMNGASISPETMDMEMTMTLNEDGSAILVASGQDDATSTWKIENSELLVDDGVTVSTMTLVDDALVTDMYGMTMTFGKEKAEIPVVEISPARVVTDVAEFDGTWKGVYVDYMGTLLPLAILEMDLTLAISGGMVQQVGMMSDSQNDTQVATGELVDGALLVTMGEGETIRTVTMQLHEDGTLSYSMTTDDTTGIIYCERIETTP